MSKVLCKSVYILLTPCILNKELVDACINWESGTRKYKIFDILKWILAWADTR